MHYFIKRTFDLLLAIFLLILLLIPFIIISVVIKLESEGPVIFKQERTGKDGKNFILYKFRSMVKNNDVRNLTVENQITKVGKFLRNTSLDELPQLINIIKNEMSFIGPRPWIPEYYELFTSYQKKRVNVKPGITGYAQVNGRNNLSIIEKIDLDIEYVNNLSLFMDIKIIFLTIKSLFVTEGLVMSKAGIKGELDTLRFNYLDNN